MQATLSKPLSWPHLQSELGALSSTKHAHSCILGAFLPPSSRYGPQASEVTKPEPRATAQGGCVTATNQPPSLRETHNGSCPAQPPTPRQRQAPALSVCLPGRGLAVVGEEEVGWIQAHPHPSPSSSLFCFPAPLPVGPFFPAPSARAPWKTRNGSYPGLGFPLACPFPRDVIAWEVGAPVWALHWQRWEEAGARRGHCRARRMGLRS